jgi:hypothetical protein
MADALKHKKIRQWTPKFYFQKDKSLSNGGFG